MSKDIERKAICRDFGICGGCLYQDKSYEEQLRIKETQVKDYVSLNGIEVERIEPIEPSPSVYGYRNKMEYTFGDFVKDGDMTLGMHQKGRFMSIVTVDECQLVPEDFNRILRTTLEFCISQGYSKYHKRRHDGLLRSLVIRKSEYNNEILVNIVTTSERGFDEEAFASMIEGLDLDGTICGVLHTINDTLSDAIKPDEVRIISGRDYYVEKIMGLEFQVSAFSFFQTNVRAVERLYRDAISLIEDVEGKVVFDLFCGTGTITQALAAGTVSEAVSGNGHHKNAELAVGVEIVEEAVESAKANAKLNGLTNCEFIAGDVLKVLPAINKGEIEGETGKIPPPDVIVVDPPRAGIHPKVLPMIAEYGVDEILYISCNPKTMCTDLAVLQEAGYKVKYMKPYDNFSMTKHCECVCLLVKSSDSNE